MADTNQPNNAITSETDPIIPTKGVPMDTFTLASIENDNVYLVGYKNKSAVRVNDVKSYINSVRDNPMRIKYLSTDDIKKETVGSDQIEVIEVQNGYRYIIHIDQLLAVDPDFVQFGLYVKLKNATYDTYANFEIELVMPNNINNDDGILINFYKNVQEQPIQSLVHYCAYSTLSELFDSTYPYCYETDGSFVIPKIINTNVDSFDTSNAFVLKYSGFALAKTNSDSSQMLCNTQLDVSELTYVHNIIGHYSTTSLAPLKNMTDCIGYYGIERDPTYTYEDDTYYANIIPGKMTFVDIRETDRPIIVLRPLIYENAISSMSDIAAVTPNKGIVADATIFVTSRNEYRDVELKFESTGTGQYRTNYLYRMFPIADGEDNKDIVMDNNTIYLCASHMYNVHIVINPPSYVNDHKTVFAMVTITSFGYIDHVERMA